MIKKPYYGYPCTTFLPVIVELTLLMLIIIALIILQFPWFIVLFIVIVIYDILKTIFNGRKFRNFQRHIVRKMIDIIDLDGNETVLDLGTGSGLVAIHFAKNLNNGMVYGLDKWKWSLGSLFRSPRLILELTTGHSLDNAKKNALLEGVSDKCNFITGSFTEKLKFPDSYFDIICSSQSLYFIKEKEKQQDLFSEINRVLKKDGKIILFEPIKPHSNLNWDIQNVESYFKNVGYEINIIPIKMVKGLSFDACIFFGKKYGTV